MVPVTSAGAGDADSLSAEEKELAQALGRRVAEFAIKLSSTD